MAELDLIPQIRPVNYFMLQGQHDALRSHRLPGNSKTLLAQFPMRVE